MAFFSMKTVNNINIKLKVKKWWRY